MKPKSLIPQGQSRLDCDHGRDRRSEGCCSCDPHLYCGHDISWTECEAEECVSICKEARRRLKKHSKEVEEWTRRRELGAKETRPLPAKLLTHGEVMLERLGG